MVKYINNTIVFVLFFFLTDNIHWNLSIANGSEITDDSSMWKGMVKGDGVDLDTKVMSLQGAGHVTLGSFDDGCPGNPSMCEEGFTVSFWMKYGGKIPKRAENQRNGVKLRLFLQRNFIFEMIIEVCVTLGAELKTPNRFYFNTRDL